MLTVATLKKQCVRAIGNPWRQTLWADKGRQWSPLERFTRTNEFRLSRIQGSGRRARLPELSRNVQATRSRARSPRARAGVDGGMVGGDREERAGSAVKTLARQVREVPASRVCTCLGVRTTYLAAKRACGLNTPVWLHDRVLSGVAKGAICRRGPTTSLAVRRLFGPENLSIVCAPSARTLLGDDHGSERD